MKILYTWIIKNPLKISGNLPSQYYSEIQAGEQNEYGSL